MDFFKPGYFLGQFLNRVFSFSNFLGLWSFNNIVLIKNLTEFGEVSTSLTGLLPILLYGVGGYLLLLLGHHTLCLLCFEGLLSFDPSWITTLCLAVILEELIHTKYFWALFYIFEGIIYRLLEETKVRFRLVNSIVDFIVIGQEHLLLFAEVIHENKGL